MYIIKRRELNNVIAITDTYKDAAHLVSMFEEDDKAINIYEENAYEIIKEEQ